MATFKIPPAGGKDVFPLCAAGLIPRPIAGLAKQGRPQLLSYSSRSKAGPDQDRQVALPTDPVLTSLRA